MNILSLLTASSCAVVLTSTARGDAYFLDLDSDVTPQMVSGSIGEASFTVSVTGAPGQFFIAPATETDCSNQISFSNTTAFNPAMMIGDTLALRKESNVGSATATVTFTFSRPLTDPLFHFKGVDRTKIEFQAVDGLTLVSSNGDSLDGLGLVDNRIFDVDPDTVNDLPGVLLTGPRSGSGTIRVNGTYTTISATLSQSAMPGDLFRIQISSEFEPPPLRITSFSYSSESGVGELHFSGAPQSLFQIRYSSTLNFAEGVILEPFSASVGLMEDGCVRSCSEGKAAVQLALGPSGPSGRGFVRVEAK